MTKKSKAETVLELLNKGWSIKKITSSFAVSAGYVSKLKKEMAHKADDNVETAKETVAAWRNEPEIDEILTERGNRYGAFLPHAMITQLLKGTMNTYLTQRNKTLMPDQQEALDMIFHKIGRILNGDPDYVDSWVDIAGYAKLVADRLQGTVR